MKTLSDNTRAVGDSAYWGERGHWFIVLAVHRDSDCLSRSNFKCAERDLKLAGSEGVDIERFNHWAVGWIDYLIIDPAFPENVKLAEQIKSKLADYPVLDEDDFSALESEEANQVWRDCYRPKDRVEYIRKHSSQFEFRDFGDMLGCVRGNYFAGCASELLN